MDFKKFEHIFCDVLPIMYKASPLISSYIGSPLTFVIIGLLASVTLCDARDHEALAVKLKEDPDLYAKLEKLESTHAKWLKDLQN